MIVAVAVPLSPPQHSPMLGHFASSQTVLNLRSRRSFLMAVYDLPVGMGCFRKDGKRGLEISQRTASQKVATRRVKTHWDVLPRTTRSGASGRGSPETKSSKVSPSSSLAKRLLGVAPSGALVAVASERELLAGNCGA